MSVASANVFALLDDEGTVDVGELAAKIPVAAKEAPVKKSDDGAKAKSSTNASRGGRANGGALDTRSFNADLAPAGESRGGKSGGNRRRGQSGGGRQKRDFDRHDATGRGHEVEKRHGLGRGNWGAEGEEVKDLEEKSAIEDGPEEGAEEAAPEEEEKQLTLEEYEAMLAEKRAGLNAKKEAAFKVDESQFKGMRTFEKQEETVDLSLQKNAKVLGANKLGKEKERKEKEIVANVGFRVQSAEEKDRFSGRGRGGAGGRGRGGRGGAKGPRPQGGRGGRGGGRHGQSKAPINFEDQKAFPSLG
eukprot:jgi/Picsp_1/5120/NSC_02483-R1_vasa intronic gene